MSTMVGKQLGKYSIAVLLGRGGMAEVYRARHPVLDREVAIKVIRSHLADEQAFIRRFQHEATAVARLRHPNIVQVYDFDVAGDLHYMVMEYVPGTTLSHELKSRMQAGQLFSLRETCTIFQALADAVGYAHQRGIIHRDLKPSNVMFTAEQQVVLTDFGIAQMMGSGNNTPDGVVTGTPTYMSPEQGQGNPVDTRTDIYALGVILYEMTTGQVPFEDTNSWVVIQKHINEPFPLPTSINPHLPPPVEQVILTATSKQPDERYQTAAVFAQALWQAAGIANEQDEQPSSALSLTTAATPAPATVELLTAPAPTLLLPPSPYRGLFAFGEQDAPFFFGREVMIDRLVDAVQQQPVVALVGPSGSGKSSLIFAGLLPHLRQGAALQQAQGRAWRIATLRPGARPFAALAAALLSLRDEQPPADDDAQTAATEALTQALEAGELTLSDVLAQIAAAHPGRLLLVIDQFEEVYTLCTDATMRRAFLDQLLTAAQLAHQQQRYELHMVLTLRADFVGQALGYRPVADVLQDTTLILGPMTRHELMQAVENPARKHGVSFEAGLIERILDDVGDEPGNLPLLEFALTLLWDWQIGNRMSHMGYEEIGRVDGALARYADSVYERLEAPLQVQMQRVLVQLVHPGEGTADTRRIAQRAELDDAHWALVQHLADTRLVITSQDAAGSEIVEVVHEALIHAWVRLRTWIDADRTFRTWQERLRAALRQWDGAGRDDGALLRGVALAEAEGWLHERTTDLTEAEQAYICASVALREREQQARERMRRRLTAAALGAAAVLAVMVVITAMGWFRAERESDERLAAQATAEARREEAEVQRQEAENQSRIALARQLASDARLTLEDTPQRSLLLAIEALQTTSKAEGMRVPAAEESLRDILSTTGGIPLHAGGETMTSIAYSSDGHWLAAGSTNTHVYVWDMQQHPPISYTLEDHAAIVQAVTFTPDDRTLITAANDQTVRLWDMADLEAEPHTLHAAGEQVTALARSPDGVWLATSTISETGEFDLQTQTWETTQQTYLWNLRQATRPPTVLTGHTQPVTQMAFSPDSRRLVTASADATLRLWDVTRLRAEPRILSRHGAILNTVGFSPDGRWLATAGSDMTVSVWDMTSLEDENGEDEPLHLRGHEFDIQALAFSPDGRWLASVSADQTVRLWNMRNLRATGLVLREHQNVVTTLAFSPDGRWLATGGWHPIIYLWDLHDPTREPTELIGHEKSISALRFSPDSRRLVSAGDTVRLWNTRNPTADSQVLYRSNLVIGMMAMSADGQTIAATIGYTATAILSSTNPMSEPLLLPSPPDTQMHTIALSADGRRLVSASNQSAEALLWDLHNPAAEPLRFSPPGGQGAERALQNINDVALSPDGTTLVTAHVDGRLMVWDAQNPDATPRIWAELPQGYAAAMLAISPDGRWLGMAVIDGKAWLLSLDDLQGAPLLVESDDGSRIEQLTFSDAGRWLATGTSGEQVQVWDLQQPERAPLSFAGFAGSGGALAFSHDEQWLLFSDEQGIRMVSLTHPTEDAVRIRGHAGLVSSIAIAPDDAWFVSSSFDGTVRLWLAPEHLIARACEVAGRNLTAQEWQQHMEERPYRATCAQE